MSEGTFSITEENQRRVIIDLLVRVCVELEANRYLVRMALSQGNQQVFQNMGTKFQEQYKKMSLKLRETIFEDYGHIDITELFPPGDEPKTP